MVRNACIALTLFVLAACKGSEPHVSGSAPHNVTARVARSADTGLAASSVTPAAGEAKVTASDAWSVNEAMQYRLTEDGFRHFIQATDSLTALRNRDPQARAWLDKEITDNGNGTAVSATDAGRKHLADYAPVRDVINSAGISVPDYFVTAIAIAQAERFMGNPKVAPPTPTLGRNAAFLDAHKAELQALRTRQRAVP